jgi:hypothetical protein
VDDYVRMVGADLEPVGRSIWMNIPGTRRWSMGRDRLRDDLKLLKEKGLFLNFSLGFDQGGGESFETAADRDVAETDQHDALIDDLAAIVRDSGVPTILRVGAEVNGPWSGHHPYVFPKAYRKVVERFRAAGADNVAFCWCIEPRGDPAIDEKNAAGEYRWFPGNDVIDWYGIDVFAREDFDPGTNPRQQRRSEVTRTLLKMAQRARKPVIVGETTPFGEDVPTGREDPNGLRARAVWKEWFEPFLAWLDANPQIKAVTMLPIDWSSTRTWSHWGDARIQQNRALSDLWRKELREPRWVHKPAVWEFVEPH